MALLSVEQFRRLSRVRARGRTRKAGEMNGTERQYAAHLDSLKLGGEILDYWFESVGFRLGKKAFFYPDFLVMLPDGVLEVHDTKGTKRDKGTALEKAFSEDDALVKLKVAAERFPFAFVAVHRLRDGSWARREF